MSMDQYFLAQEAQARYLFFKFITVCGVHVRACHSGSMGAWGQLAGVSSVLFHHVDLGIWYHYPLSCLTSLLLRLLAFESALTVL